MDPESKKLLEDTFKLSQENSILLKSLHRSMRVRRVMSIIYWIFIIGSAVGAYYIIEPYANQVMEMYDGAKTNLEGFNDFFQNIKK